MSAYEVSYVFSLTNNGGLHVKTFSKQKLLYLIQSNIAQRNLVSVMVCLLELGPPRHWSTILLRQ